MKHTLHILLFYLTEDMHLPLSFPIPVVNRILQSQDLRIGNGMRKPPLVLKSNTVLGWCH